MTAPAATVLMIGNFFSSRRHTRSPTEDLAEHLTIRGWTVIARPTAAGRAARIPQASRAALLDGYDAAWVDVYSGRAFHFAAWVASLARSRRRPYVLVLRGGRLPEFASRSGREVRHLLGGAARIVTPSTYLQDEFSARGYDVEVVPNGLHLGRFTYAPRDPIAPRVLWLRAFHGNYRPHLAIEAAAELSDLAGFHLTMVGPDKGDGSLERCRTLVDAHGLADRVTIRGGIPHTQVPDLLSDNHVFLNTTRYESFGMAVMEAAAAGTAIVSTRVGEMGRLWHDGRNAVLVDPTPAAIAGGIRRIVEAPDKTTTLVAAARAVALHHDIRHTFSRCEQILRSVVVP